MHNQGESIERFLSAVAVTVVSVGNFVLVDDAQRELWGYACECVREKSPVATGEVVPEDDAI